MDTGEHDSYENWVQVWVQPGRRGSFPIISVFQTCTSTSNPTVSAKCERGLAPLFAFDGKGFEPGADRRALKQDLLLHYSSCVSGICNNRCHEGSIKTISSRFFLCRCLSSSQIAKSATVHLVLLQIFLM